jgi:hypothetical protein
MEGEGQAIALLAAFQVAEEPPDVGQKQVTDLGLLLS